MAATVRLELELAPATAEAFALLLGRLHGSFCELLANTGDEAEAMHHAASLVRGQIALQGMKPDTRAGQGKA